MKKLSLKRKDDVVQNNSKFISEVKKCRSENNKTLDSLEQSIKDNKSTESVSTTCDAMIAVTEERSSFMNTQQRISVISSPRSRCPPRLPRLPTLHHLPTLPPFPPSLLVAYNSPFRCSRSVSLKYIGEVNTRHSTDSSDDGCIIGGAMLENNMLSLIDCLTYSVKIIDVNKNTVISCIKLPTRPWDITRIEPEQIVVLCDNKLVFIKVGQTLSLVKEVNISGDCCGIVYTNNTFIVSFLNPGSVKVIDLDGQILKIISLDENGQSYFDEPCCIALSPDHSTLYVSDEGNSSVTSMYLNGTVQHVYTHDDLMSPRSLAVDRKGNIYIAGRGSYNMHIISSSCKNIRIFYEEICGINSPYAVIYCERDDIFYISHFQGLGNPVNIVSAYQVIIR